MFGPSQPNSLGLPCESLLHRWVQNDSLFIAGLRVIHFLPLVFRAIHFFFIAGFYMRVTDVPMLPSSGVVPPDLNTTQFAHTNIGTPTELQTKRLMNINNFS